MNPENTGKLLATYPLLYRELRGRQFECGDGWFDLVWQLSAKIEAAARAESMPETPESWPSISVLKYKFGTLRISFSFSVTISQAIRELVFKDSERSAWICDECGAIIETEGKPCQVCRGG